MAFSPTRAAYARLPHKSATAARTAHATQDATFARRKIMDFLYIEIVNNPNKYFIGDVLDIGKLTDTTMHRLQANDWFDEDFCTATVVEFSVAIGRAEAKEEGGNMSFKAALLEEIM